MPETVETFRTTKALRALVRKAARFQGMSPSEFLRLAAEEKARAVIAGKPQENLRVMLDSLPRGRVASDAKAGRVGLGGHPKPANEGRLKTGQRN